MSDVKENDIRIVVDALKQFHQDAVSRGVLDIGTFVGVMESKFAEAGYRGVLQQGGGLHFRK